MPWCPSARSAAAVQIQVVIFPPLEMPFEWHESCAAGRVPSVPNKTNLTDKKHADFIRKTWTQLIDMADQ
jgi:hypothetical protein